MITLGPTFCLYYEIPGAGGNVIRGKKYSVLEREANLMHEGFPDAYIEVFMIRKHKHFTLLRHDGVERAIA